MDVGTELITLDYFKWKYSIIVKSMHKIYVYLEDHVNMCSYDKNRKIASRLSYTALLVSDYYTTHQSKYCLSVK